MPPEVYRDASGAEQHNYHIYNQFVIRVPQRDELRRHLNEHGIGCEVYYPLCLHQQACLAPYGMTGLSFPEAEQAAAETLALPIYPELTSAQQEYVVQTIAGFYQ